jgi:glycosyltransferase involved in cell wall biosynthesis
MCYGISVIVPVYNVRNKVLKSLESLKEQTFKDFEVLFIDDGSPDDSSDVIDSYLKESDVNYRIIKKENGGVSSARNLAIDEAKGKYVQFLDPDDYIEKDMFKELYDKVIETDSDIVYSGYFYEENDGKELYNNMKNLKPGLYSGKEAALGYIYGYSYTHGMASLIKRSLLKEYNIKFDINRKYAEDIAFHIKSYSHANRVCCMDKIYCHYVKWGDSVTNNISSNFLDSYYSNIDTLNYIKENICDEDIEKAMIENRIPISIVVIVSAFAVKSELQEEMNKFINRKDVRNYLKRHKVYKVEKDQIKYFILSKMILFMPNLIKKYYSRRA